MGFSLSADLSNVQMLFVLLALAWSLAWKGVALWKSARHGQPAWFVCLLIINTVGILEIVYISFFQKKTA